jgi:Fic family protein
MTPTPLTLTQQITITRASLAALLQQRREITGWKPKLREGSVAALINLYLQTHGEIRNKDVHRLTHTSKNTAKNTLSVMSRAGLIERVGHGRYRRGISL